MAWKWFGVKSLYRSEVVLPLGKAPQKHLLSERVVLIKARTFDEALAKGEKEAESYAALISRSNADGDTLKTRCLGCDAFALSDEPENMVEVYSSDRLMPAKQSKERILDAAFGSSEMSDRDRRLMQRFEPSFDATKRAHH